MFLMYRKQWTAVSSMHFFFLSSQVCVGSCSPLTVSVVGLTCRHMD